MTVPVKAQNWSAQQSYGSGSAPGLAAPMAVPIGFNQFQAQPPQIPGYQSRAMVPGMPGYAPAANIPPNPNMLGMVPKFNPDFFKNRAATLVSPGTVLTGILEEDLSSKKNKAGDVFSIRLEDGFSANGNQIIPKQSKILGSISAVQSSTTRKGAMPGTITISLQTIVLPDGRTCPICGFIEHNPLSDATQPNSSNPQKTATDYTKHMGFSAMNFFTRRVGFNMTYPNFGLEFQMKKGEVLPIRLNRALDMSNMTPPAPSQSASPLPPVQQPTQQVGLSAGQMGSLSQAPQAGRQPGSAGFNQGFNGPSFTGAAQAVPGLVAAPNRSATGSPTTAQPEPF
jgi:hypothetical protein